MAGESFGSSKGDGEGNWITLGNGCFPTFGRDDGVSIPTVYRARSEFGQETAAFLWLLSRIASPSVYCRCESGKTHLPETVRERSFLGGVENEEAGLRQTQLRCPS